VTGRYRITGRVHRPVGYIIPYGGHDEGSQGHFHRGYEYSSLVVYRRKKLKTFFEIDEEFENMMTVMKSNFVTVDSFDSSMRVSLRQTLIDRCVY
jgi:hypothetical protein